MQIFKNILIFIQDYFIKIYLQIYEPLNSQGSRLDNDRIIDYALVKNMENF